MAEDCTAYHCGQQQGNVNEICKREKWPEGHRVLICDQSGYCCNCRCSCFQFGTLIATPAGVSKIEEITVGSSVLATGTGLKWAPVVVEFSNGTGRESIAPFMREIGYKQGGLLKKVTCTKDQPFLMASKLLKRADKINTGDKILLADGSTVEVTDAVDSSVTVGIHHISTGTVKPTTLEGHLLNAEGFVVADYVVQLFQDELQQYFEQESASEKLAERRISVKGKAKEISLEKYVADGIQKTYTYWHHTLLAHTLTVPDNASTFVTEKQALEVHEFVPKHSPLDGGIVNNIEYLFKIFKVFYPEVSFLLDWHSDGGNAFATRLGSYSYVILQGGLARAKALELGGLSIVLAHELGHLYGGDPQGPGGYSCDTQADFYGVRIVMRKVWYEDLYALMVFPGIKQIGEVFTYLSDSTIKEPGCVTPTLSCRLDTFRAGATSQYPPACAGGPTYDFLAVTGAVSNQATEVDIHFNEAVNKKTAENIKHYSFEPEVEIGSAKVSGTDATVVKVIANLTSGTEYRVTVSNVIAENKEQLDPEKSSADFEAK